MRALLGYSASIAAAQLVCWRRSSWQLGAGVDDPHTERKISRRPLSTCGSSWPNPEAKHATSAGAASCRWCARRPSQPISQFADEHEHETSELGWDLVSEGSDDVLDDPEA